VHGDDAALVVERCAEARVERVPLRIAAAEQRGLLGAAAQPAVRCAQIAFEALLTEHQTRERSGDGPARGNESNAWCACSKQWIAVMDCRLVLRWTEKS
jgi:hypothetical protein